MTLNHSKLKRNYIPELLAFLSGRKKPSMVSVNLTDQCNQKCIYCEIGQGEHSPVSGRLTKNDLFWIIDQMEIIKLKKLSINGGEPFLFPDILPVIEYAHSKNIRCNITSNGMTIHQLDRRELELLSEWDTHINISIDSFDNAIQTFTRGNSNALSNAVKSIGVLRKHKIAVTVLCAISKYNNHDLFDTFTSVYKLGLHEVLFQPIISCSNYPDRPAIKSKRFINVEPEKLTILQEQLDKIRRFEKRHAIHSNVYRIKPWISAYIETAAAHNREWFFDKILKKFYCREVGAVIDITYTGGIQACGLSPATERIQTNKETDLLTQWTAATSGLKNDLSKQNYPAVCNGCCHKFSRNMLASVMKYPIANREVLFAILIPVFNRIIMKLYKKVMPNFR